MEVPYGCEFASGDLEIEVMKEINAKKMVNVPLAVAQALYGSKGLRPVVFRCRKPLEPGHQPGHCVKYTCIFKVCIRPNKAHGRNRARADCTPLADGMEVVRSQDQAAAA